MTATGLALFDFDGTITDRDSFFVFLQHSAGWMKTAWGAIRLGHILAGHMLGLVDNGWAKEQVIAWFFRGWSEERFREVANSFARRRITPLIRPAALERIRWHQGQGHRVAIVSASLELYLEDWCHTLGLDLVGTRIEIERGILTGRLAGLNCYGPEKVRRIQERFSLADYDRIFAYGDSGGDREMLAIAHEAFFRPFV